MRCIKTIYMFAGRAIIATVLAGTAACGGSRDATRGAASYVLLGETTIAFDTRFESTQVGGLSSIDLAPDGKWYLICDDRSAKSAARFYTADIDIGSSGRIDARFTSVDTIRDINGQPFARGMIDAEAMRFDPSSGTMWISSEGDESMLLNPFVREMRPDGSFIRQLPLPTMFRMDTTHGTGARDNGVFEGMTLSADSTQLIVSTEEVLKQDGPSLSNTATGPVRISFYDRVSGRLVRQVAYVPELAQSASSDTIVGGNGVVDVLARDADHLLVLERAYTPGVGNTVRLFEAQLSTGSNVASLRALAGAEYRAVAKTLVADFGAIGLKHVDNIEGITWGPIVSGRNTLVAVSDNNFNPEQVTQIVVLIEKR